MTKICEYEDILRTPLSKFSVSVWSLQIITLNMRFLYGPNRDMAINISVWPGRTNMVLHYLRVIICKDQTETENFDSGILKISSYLHMLVIT